MGWRRDHFRCCGELEGDVQLCVTSRERLQSKTCLSALLPKICHMGKLVLGKGMGIWGPRSLRGHGRTPLAGGRPRTFSDCLRALRGGHSTRPFCNLSLKKCSFDHTHANLKSHVFCHQHAQPRSSSNITDFCVFLCVFSMR